MSRSRQLAAIMFTDIKGYTALMQQNEEKAIQARDKHRRVFNSITEKYQGKILQYYGDGTLSIFDSAIDAVKCGIEMQLGFQEDPVIPVRIGIHTGDIIFDEEEIIGDSVNVASRIESLAVPGSVFISDKVYDEIKNQESIKTCRLQTFKLKNVERPIEVFAIANAGLIVPNPEDIGGKTEADTNEPNEAKQPPPNPQTAGIPFLATKLFIPPPRPKAVLRPHLIERLNAGIHGKMTLISAPAGFGKTSLVSEWIAGSKYPAAWLSLDERDNEPTRFWAYVVAGLQKIEPQIGEGILGMLHSPQPLPTESILIALINEITTIPNKFVFVLDDYHLIDSRIIDEGLSFLLKHLPPQMHLAIATREDPNLPLARLRARGQLTELRVTDLRFTSPEVVGFFNQVMGLNLSAEHVGALEARTEGWIAGLQMAALSLQGRTDTASFIQAFTGSHHFIIDYLVEEVLHQQPETIRNFLLQTSILSRLNGPLCDAVTGQESGTAMLESLERGNLFVVPLDDKRQWYRYHHLFADVLRAHALKENPHQIPILHQRASKWYEQHGSAADAIYHALAAEDVERAAGLIELVWPAMDGSFQTATWLNWVKKLPDELVRVRPVLIVGYAWAYLNDGELEAGEAYLRDAEKWIDIMADPKEQLKPASTEMVVVDEEQFRFLPASIATARAYYVQALGDVEGSIKYAQRALDLLPEKDHLRRGPAAALLGLAYWANGDLEAAHRALAEAMANFQLAGHLLFAVSGTFGMGDIRITQGRLREAVSTYERSLQLVLENGEPLLQGIADLYLGLGDLSREQGDLETAVHQIAKSVELGEQAALPDWPCRLALAQARLKEAQGDVDGALKLLHKAAQLYYRTPIPNSRPIAALMVPLWLKRKQLAKALNWIKEQGLSVDDKLGFLREFEHMTLARVLIAEYNRDKTDQSIHKALKLLDRLLKAAEDSSRMGHVIEILVLQSLAFKAQKDIPHALVPLQRALTLAEPEGYVCIFTNEGVAMAELLSEAVNHGIMADYANKLLTVSGVDHSTSPNRSLIEPLSDRELEILRLIAQGLSNQEICKRLFLALSTVKGHNRNIFGKLEVQRRTEAVARARELGLL